MSVAQAHTHMHRHLEGEQVFNTCSGTIGVVQVVLLVTTFMHICVFTHAFYLPRHSCLSGIDDTTGIDTLVPIQYPQQEQPVNLVDGRY